MHPHEFDATSFHANTRVEYQGELLYVIAINFEERLFALCNEKADIPAEDWTWVRCENVTLLKPKVYPFKQQ